MSWGSAEDRLTQKEIRTRVTTATIMTITVLRSSNQNNASKETCYLDKLITPKLAHLNRQTDTLRTNKRKE